MTNPLDDLLEGIEDLSNWIQGKKKTTTQKVVKDVKKQVKKGGRQAENLAHKLVHKAKVLGTEIEHFVNDLEKKPTKDEEMLREFQARATDLNYKIDTGLKKVKNLADDVKEALTNLKKAIVAGLKQIGSFLKSLVSAPAPHPALSHGPSFTPHRKDRNVHLDKEKQFKAHQHTAKHPEAHRKILPNKGGNR